jgi:hypothetical protein
MPANLAGMSWGWSFASGRAAVRGGVIALSLVACASNDLKNGAPAATDGGGGNADATTPPQDSGPPPPPVDSGNGDENPVETACTAAPFVNFAATLSVVAAGDAIGPANGASVQFTSCPGFQVAASADGKIFTKITKGIALSPFYAAAPAALTTVGAEIPATTDVDVTALLIAQSESVAPNSVIPEYDGKTPTILLEIVAEGTTAPCNAVDGVAITATGHQEMVAHYMKTGWPADKTVASNSASSGKYAFFSGVQLDAGAAFVSLEGAKNGCQVKLVTAAQTGRFMLVQSAITVGRATVTN